MDDMVITIAAEVATFYNALLANGVGDYQAVLIANQYLAMRMQYGKLPAESPYTPQYQFPIGETK